ILHLHDTEPAFFHEGLDKIIRGAAQLVSYAETMQEEVQCYIEPSRQRAERAKASKRRLRSGGVVSSSNVQAMKCRKVKVNISNEKKKWKRKYAKVLPELIETCKEWGIIQKRVQKVRWKAGE
ncbi:uncharacterized protein BDV14DRAFT_168979, partial [Aspergillus stella-maris]|uniref:uncharacterized protein n=1 Tax=Aspergillus stella-maris TaxID=1810926 RepID=UPI003CCDAFA5